MQHLHAKRRRLPALFAALVLTIGLLLTAAPTAEATGILDTGTLTISAIDSVTLKPLEGVTYHLSRDPLFGTSEHTLTTLANGTATVDLKVGLWYLKQASTLTGYVPYTQVIPVSLGLGNLRLDLKNTPCGTLEIHKVDENDQPVKGAEFSLFTGLTAIGTPLFTKLTSDVNGQITVANVVPGQYTLLETYVGENYHLNATPHTFEITAGNTKIIKIVNSTIKLATLELYKKDAATEEPLAGAVFGIYTDAAYTLEINQAVSLVDKAAVVSLLPGTYYIKELVTPEGYLPDAQPQTVTLTEGAVVTSTFYNTRSYPTAGNFGLLLVCGAALLLFCGLLALWGKKHFKNK